MENIKISVQDLNLHYGTNHALKHVNMEIQENAITAFIGPSGCGKSTFLKCLNRMNDLVENVKIEGKVLIDGEDIYSPKADTTRLRKKVGMVFQQANPFPMGLKIKQPWIRLWRTVCVERRFSMKSKTA